MAIKFEIPEEHYSMFINFVKLPDELKEDINKSLSNANFGGKPKELLNKIYTDLSKKIEKDDVWEIVRVYLNLVNLKNTIENDLDNEDNFQTLLKESLLHTKQKELDPTDKVINDFMNLISSSESISIETKLLDLQIENPHSLLDVEIFNDIRPLINNKGKIEGCSIINQLKLIYRENNTNKEFYIALDNDDLNKLSKIIKKAQENYKSIQESFPNILFLGKEDI